MASKGDLWDSKWAPRGQAVLLRQARITMEQRQAASGNSCGKDVPAVDSTRKKDASPRTKVKENISRPPLPRMVDSEDQPPNSSLRDAEMLRKTRHASFAPGSQDKASVAPLQAESLGQHATASLDVSSSRGYVSTQIRPFDEAYGVPFTTGTTPDTWGLAGPQALSYKRDVDPEIINDCKCLYISTLPLPTTKDISMPTELLGDQVLIDLGHTFGRHEYTLDKGLMCFYSGSFRKIFAASDNPPRFPHVSSSSFRMMKSWLYTRRLDDDNPDLSQLLGLYITGSHMIVPVFTNFITNLIINKVITMLTQDRVFAFSDLNCIYSETTDLPEQFGDRLRQFFVEYYTLTLLEGRTVFHECERESADKIALRDFNHLIGQSNTDGRLVNLLRASINFECRYHEHYDGRTCQS